MIIVEQSWLECVRPDMRLTSPVRHPSTSEQRRPPSFFINVCGSHFRAYLPAWRQILTASATRRVAKSASARDPCDIMFSDVHADNLEVG